MFSFQKKYFFLTIILFLIEVFIALYVHDRIVRPYIGDFLVVILMYCFFKSFLKVPGLVVALPVLAFAYLLETLQYFNVVTILGLQHSKFARVILGSSFEWIDMLAYTLGILFVIAIERLQIVKRSAT